MSKRKVRQWLSPPAWAKRARVSHQLALRWMVEATTALGGRVIRQLHGRIRCSPGYRRRQVLLAAKDADTIAALAAEDDWPTIAQAAKAFDLRRGTIYSWTHAPVHALGGRRLRRQLRWLRDKADTLRETWTVSRADLEKITQYSAPSDWLTIPEAATEAKVKEGTIRQWLRYCPALGRQLVARRQVTGRPGKPVVLVSPRDLEAIQGRKHEPDAQVAVNGKQYLLLGKAAVRLGISVSTMRSWYSENCCWLGRPVERVLRSQAGQTWAYVSLADVEASETKRRQAKRGGGSGPRYLLRAADGRYVSSAPANGQASEAAATNDDAAAPVKRKRSRGRPRGSIDEELRDKQDALLAKFETDPPQWKSKRAMARALRMEPSTVRRWLNEARKRRIECAN